MQRKKGETYRVATGDAEKKSSNQGNSQLDKAHTRKLKVQHKICSIMKTFTYKQAIEVLNKFFKGYRILKKFDGIRELSILFRDANGKKWELLSTADPYFQTVEDYVIIEA